MEFNLEEIQGIHAKRRNDACADPCSGMILDVMRRQLHMLPQPNLLTKAWLGKTLACCLAIPAIAGQLTPDLRFFRSEAELRIAVLM